MSKDEFVQMMTADLAEAPLTFRETQRSIRSGARELSELEPPQAFTIASGPRIGETTSCSTYAPRQSSALHTYPAR